jgi:hypothetical protein
MGSRLSTVIIIFSSHHSDRQLVVGRCCCRRSAECRSIKIDSVLQLTLQCSLHSTGSFGFTSKPFSVGRRGRVAPGALIVLRGQASNLGWGMHMTTSKRDFWTVHKKIRKGWPILYFAMRKSCLQFFWLCANKKRPTKVESRASPVNPLPLLGRAYTRLSSPSFRGELYRVYCFELLKKMAPQ